MHIPNSVLGNETHFRDFVVQTDYLMPAKRSDLMKIKKKNKKGTSRLVDFAVSVDITVII